jgi:phosphatidylinositol alpha-mannosyltransferase
VRLLLARHRLPEEGIDVLGLLPQQRLTEELLTAKALVAPSVGMESFGMVLTRALACALPVVASDIPGYRDVIHAETGLLVPPGDARALADAVALLLGDEPQREAFGVAGRRVAEQAYSWDKIAERLLGVYGLVAGRPAAVPAPLEAVPA